MISLCQEEEVDKNMDDWILWTIKTLKKASPTSLKIFLRSIRTWRLQGVGQCLIHEYRMSCTIIRGKVCRDFFEVPIYYFIRYIKRLQSI
ncbi:putative 3-hydroxyisobutyryl-CoA hydrolase [Helianthus anomalus]